MAMAYVRKKGNQLVLVHGQRTDGGVRQCVLFTIYSKGEALAILGRREDNSAEQFKMLVEHQYPDIRFDWKKIRRGIEENLDVLPDLYEYKQARAEKRFRNDLDGFARQLFMADPQGLISSANLIKEHRYELEFLQELIAWRLRLCEQSESKWNKDNPFYWRYALQGSDVPVEAEEFASGCYKRGDLRRAEAAFNLLIRCFDGYAEGRNYLGLIALDEQRYDDAIQQFEKTVEVGRTLFPKRASKKRYWTDHATRPYMRGLRNLALTLNESGRFEDALEMADRLDRECGDDVTACWHRAVANLNLARWREAASNAEKIVELQPDAGFIEAFALEARGKRREALPAFLNASLNYPRATRMLLNVRVTTKPDGYEEVEDHNAGVRLLRSLKTYLSKLKGKPKEFFKAILTDERVVTLLEEEVETTRRWRETRTTTSDRSDYKRMMLMKARAFAEAEAYHMQDLWDTSRASAALPH